MLSILVYFNIYRNTSQAAVINGEVQSVSIRAAREDSRALRLENVSLREPLSDLRAGNANLIFAHGVRKELGENLPVPQPMQKGRH